MKFTQAFFYFQCACTFTLAPLLVYDHELAWKLFFFGAHNPERLTSLVYAAALCGEGCLQLAVARNPPAYLQPCLIFMLPYKISAVLLLLYAAQFERITDISSETCTKIALAMAVPAMVISILVAIEGVDHKTKLS